jgi:hypothetical protein
MERGEREDMRSEIRQDDEPENREELIEKVHNPVLVSQLQRSRNSCLSSFLAFIVCCVFLFFESWVIFTAPEFCQDAEYIWFIVKAVFDLALALLSLFEAIALLFEIGNIKKKIVSSEEFQLKESYASRLTLFKSFAACINVGILIWGLFLWDSNAEDQCQRMDKVLHIVIIVSSSLLIFTCLIPCILLCIFGLLSVTSTV